MTKQEPVQLADSEIFQLSSLEEDERPIKLFKRTDEESGGVEKALLRIDEEAKPPESGGKAMTLSGLIYYLTLIGIVSIASPVEVATKLMGTSSRPLLIEQFSKAQKFATCDSVFRHSTSLL